MIEETWDLMAVDYEGFTNKASSYSNAIEWPAVKAMLPRLEGKETLDIGCGTGRFTFYLNEFQPKSSIGIDISAKMIEIANGKNSAGNIRFIKCSALDITKTLKKKFDFIFSSTASHYFPSLTDVFRCVHEALRDDGVFILSAMHPVYTAQYPLNVDDDWKLRYQDKEVREYLQPWTEYGESKNGVACRSFQHTFSDYINAFIGSGFEILGIDEPLPPAEWKVIMEERYDAIFNQPLYLIIKARKKSAR